MAKKVLFVDRNNADRQSFRAHLRDDFTVFEASNSDEALSLLRLNYKAISVILLDLSPDSAEDGFALLKEIRGNPGWRQIPVIAVSADAGEAMQRRAYELGISWFVQKPFVPELLISALSNNMALRDAAFDAKGSSCDRLTGIYTRDAFFSLAEQMIRRRPSGSYVLSCFDIDSFKVVNDQYGLEMGDDVLCHTADVLSRAAARMGGLCCRLMADNFGILYPAHYLNSKLLNDTHREAMSPTCISRGIRFRIGRYLVTDLSLPVSAMYDRAMLAQESIRGRYDVFIADYDENMRRHLLHEQQIVQEMYGALESGQFEVWLQPQFNHATGAMIGSEALVRWRHPKDGLLVPPGDFIPTFERNGFIYELDKYVWEQVCVTLRRWMDGGLPLLPVSVNISRYDVFHPDFISVITGLIVKYDLPVELMHLEITESSFAGSGEQVLSKIKELIRLGFTVEIDDFGSGYSSLNTLKDVPATVVKLDMRFLEGDDGSTRGGSILESIVRMAKWLGMSVIAEGVETKAQADYLKSIGCFYHQGYLFARPMPVTEYEELVRLVATEKKDTRVETVETLDNAAFWNPKSMDTLIFNSYVGGAVIIEYHNGRAEVLRSNERYAREFGDSTIGGVPVYDLPPEKCMDKENYAAMLSNIQAAIDTRVESTCEIRIGGLDGDMGKALYLRCTARMIARVEERYLLYCIVYNITTWREAEQKERNLVDQLQTIINNIPGGVSAVSFQKKKQIFLFANDSFYAQLGCTREDYHRVSRKVLDFVHPDDYEKIRAVQKELEGGARATTVAYRVFRSDGATRWFESRVSIVRFPAVDGPIQLTVTNDITALKEANEHLRFLNDMAHNLLGQPDTDAGIHGTLKKLMDYFSGRRAYIFEFDQNAGTASNTYEVCAPNVSGEKAGLQNMPMSAMEFWLESFRQQNYQLIEDVDALDDSHAQIRDLLRSQGVKSIIILPLRRGEEVFGFLGIDDGCHPEALINDLLAISDFIAVILTKHAMHQKIMGNARSLRQIMDDCPGGFNRMYVAPDMTVKSIYANRLYLRMLGLTEEQFKARRAESFLSVLHPDDAAAVRAMIKQAIADRGTKSLEFRVLRGNGKYVRLHAYGSAVRDEMGDEYLNVFYTDMLNPGWADEQQRKLLDYMPCGAGICEVSGDSARIIYLNKRYREYFTHDVGRMSTVSVFDVVHPDDREKLKSLMRPALFKGGENSCILRIKNGPEEYIPFRLTGTAAEYRGGKNYIYITLTPIKTEELSFEEMLPVALEAMMASSSDYFFVKDLNLRYVCCSQAMAELYGMTSGAQIAGKTDYDLFDKARADRYAAEDRRMIETGESIIDFVEPLPFLTKDKTMRYSLSSKYLLRNSAGTVIGLYGFSRDVTKARETDTQLKLLADGLPGGLATYSCTLKGAGVPAIRLLYCNDGFRTLFGLSAQVSAVPDPVRVVCAEDRPELNRQVTALLKEGTPINCVFRTRVAGKLKWISEKGVPVEKKADSVTVSAVLLDVTEHMEAMERLRISEEEYRLAMQHTGSDICHFDVAGRTLSMAPDLALAREIPERISDMPMSMIGLGRISKESEKTYIDFYEAIIRGEKHGEMIVQIKFASGWRALEEKFTTLFGAGGQPVSAVISFADVTERIEKETIYKKWQQSLLQKDPASYTLFRTNLSRPEMTEIVEGTLLHYTLGNKTVGFNERTQEYAEQWVYEPDRDAYEKLMNSDALLASYYRGKRLNTMEYRELLPKGRTRWLRLTLELVERLNSTDIEAYLMYENIDSMKREELQTKARAETDPLTGVLNRKAFAERMTRAMAWRQSAFGALFMLDLDCFKQVNDSFGHDKGDQTLIEVGQIMSSLFRAQDLICRLGGDEFLVFLSDIPSREVIAHKAETLLRAVREALRPKVKTSVSIGIAVAPDDGGSFETLYRKADIALYHVKASGKNSFAFYEKGMRENCPDASGAAKE